MKNGFLYNQLLQARPDLAKNLDYIYQCVQEIWSEQSLRTFTTHGQPHYKQVEANLDSLTRPLQSSRFPLEAEEIYVMLAACCLHDIGMQLDEPDARARHAQYAYDLIVSSTEGTARDKYVRLPLWDPTAREVIGLIAKGHWTEYALELPKMEFVGDNRQGRVRLLGLLLATADLLDLSSGRGRFFHSPHRLYALPAIAELHQRMHDLVWGYTISPTNPAIPEDLQFLVTWRDNGEMVREMSDWVLHRFTSEWSKLRKLLYLDSGGAIRWAKPWSCATFRAPGGPSAKLSEPARWILRANRVEQRRINRKGFVDAFVEHLNEPASALFILPNDPRGDAKWLSEWSVAQARMHERVRTARVDIRSALGLGLPGIIAVLLAQWGKQLPASSDIEALEKLREELKADRENAFVSVIVTEQYDGAILPPLIEALTAGPLDHSRICILFSPSVESREILPPIIEAFRASSLAQSRICVFFSPSVNDFESIDGMEIHKREWLPIGKEEIYEHLKSSWGLPEEKSNGLAEEAVGLGLGAHPALLYHHIEDRCRVWHCRD